MPDYDLGTAHGKIRIEADSTGVAAVNSAIDQFKRAIDAIVARTAAFDAAMNSMERELRQVRNDFAQASAAAEGYNRTLTIVHVSSQQNAQSQGILARNLANARGGLLAAAAAAAQYHQQISMVYRFTRSLQASNGGLIGFNRALGQSGLASAGLTLLMTRFLGISRVMSQAPQWQRNMLNFSNSLRLVTVAYAGMRYLPDILSRITSSSRIAASTVSTLGRAFAPVVTAIRPLTGALDGVLQSISRLPNHIAQSVIGWNVMRGGIQGLMAPINGLKRLFSELPGWIKAVVGAFALMGPAIVEGLAATLRFTSNIINGMITAVKDLAGGFLALPGAFAMAGAAAVPLLGILATLKNAFGTLFKDAFSNDMQKVTQDLNKMPDYLRPLGQEIVSLVPRLRALGDQFTATFTAGMGDQIERIAGTYLPALYDGGTRVASAFRNVKDQFAAFLMQGQTVADTNELFSNTSRAINAVANNLQPVLRGLRDIGIVGSEFIRDLAERHLPRLADGFAQWAARERETGQARAWMDRAVHAAGELWVGTKNAVEAVGQLLTLFRTGSGETTLQHYAEDMKKFNDEVRRSAASGTLHDIAESVKGLGTDHIHELVDAMKQIAPAIGSAIGFIAQFVGAFSGTLVPSLELAAQVLHVFLDVINAMGGGAVLGTVLGMAAAWKLVTIALSPVANGIRIAIGAFSLMRGLDGMVLKLGTALESMGGIGVTAAEKLVGAFAMLRTAISLTIGVVTAALAAFMVYKEGADEIDRAQQAITDSAKHTKDSIEDIKQAMIDDHGIAGQNVFTAIKQSVDQAMSDLEAQSQAMPGVLARITDFLRGGNMQDSQDNSLMGGAPGWLKDITLGIPIIGSYLNMGTGSSNKVNDQSKMAEQATKTKQALDKLTITNRDVAVAVSKGGPAWDDLINKLKSLGTDGQPAIDFLTKLRDNVKQGEDAGKAAAGATGQQTAAMTDAERAAAAYGTGAHTLAEALAHIGIEAQQANDAIMGSADQYNKFLLLLRQKQAAPSIIDMVQRLRQQFENGGAAVNSFAEAIDKMNDKMAAADDKAQTFISSLEKLGVIPNDDALSKYNEDIDKAIGLNNQLVDMTDRLGNSLVEQSGKIDLNSKNGRQLSQTMRQLIQDNVALVESGRASPDEAYTHTTEALRRMFAEFQITDPNIQNSIIQQYFPPNAFQNAIKAQDPKGALEQLFANDPAKLNTALNFLQSRDDIVNNFVDPQDGKLHIPTVLDVAPPVPPAPPADPNAPPPGAPPGAPSAGPQPPPGQPPLGPILMPQANAPSPQQIGDRLASAGPAGLTAMMMQANVTDVLGPFIQNATNQGESLSQAFADGIQNGSPAVKEAILKLAALAGDGLGHSPAKYGPLSGTGWTYYRGQSFATDWAGGISAGAPAVKDAAKDVAYGAVTGMTDKNEQWFKQLSEMGSFIGHIADLGKQVVDSFLNIGKAMNLVSGGRIFPKGYVTDPLRYQQGQSNALPWSPGGWTPPTGGGAGPGVAAAPAALRAGAGQQDIANYIIQKAMSQGYSRDQANQFVVQAVGESGLSPTANNPAGWRGIFQFDTPTWQGAGGGDVNNAQQNIDNYFNLARQRGLTPANFNDPHMLGTQVSIGGPLNPRNTGAEAIARQQAQQYINAFRPGPMVPSAGGPTIAQPTGIAGVPNANLPGAGTNYTPAWAAAHGFRPLFAKTGPGGDATQADIPPYLRALAAAFQLPISSHPDTTLHGNAATGSWAVDIGGPGSNPAQMEALARFLSQNMAPDIMQLIHRSATTDYGIAGGQNVGGPRGTGTYYTTGEGYSVHTDHVHVAFALPFGQVGAGQPSAAPTVNAPLPVNIQQQGGQNVPPGGLNPNPNNIQRLPAGAPAPPGFTKYTDSVGTAYYVPGNVPGFDWNRNNPSRVVGGVTGQGAAPPGYEWVRADTNMPGANLRAPMGSYTLTPVGGDMANRVPLQPPPQQPGAQPGPVQPGQQPPSPGQPDGTTQNPLNVQMDSGQLGSLDQLNTVSQQLQDIGVPQNIGTKDEAVRALQSIDVEIQRQNNLQTPQGKMMADQLGQIHSSIQQQWNLKETPSTLDTMSSIASGVSGVVSDFIGTFQSFVEVVGATKNIGDALVRGPASTEDVISIVQNFQKYLEFAAKVANTVGDVFGQIGGILGAAGSASGMPGGGGPGAALQGIQAIAQAIAGVIQAVNASISLSIEAWHIFGSYFGSFLGFLAGGPAGLQGNVKFLLDQNTGQLLSYSTDNPMKRNALPVPGQVVNPNANNQAIGQLNYYAGPGQDPRDSTRQMMYQVKSSQMNTVVAQ